MFKYHRASVAKTETPEIYLATDSEAIALGEILTLTSGRLTKTAATSTPEFVALATKAAGTDVSVPVKRIYEDEVYETTFAATASSINVGDKVTNHTDGLQVTATTTSGVFHVTEILGAGVSGTGVRGIFRR